MFAQIFPILRQRRWSSFQPSQTNLETAGRSHPRSPHERDNSSRSPSPPHCMHQEDHLWLWICIFIYLKSHQAYTSVLCRSSSLLHGATSKARAGIRSGWARLHKQEVSSWSDGLTFSKACRIVAGRQDSSPGAHACDCRTFPRPLCSPPRLTVRGWFFELLY